MQVSSLCDGLYERNELGEWLIKVMRIRILYVPLLLLPVIYLGHYVLPKTRGQYVDSWLSHV